TTALSTAKCRMASGWVQASRCYYLPSAVDESSASNFGGNALSLSRETPPQCLQPQGPAMISIVVPAYNEERNVDALYRRVTGIMDTVARDDWELVFVDDGSTDQTWRVIEGLNANDARVRG